MLRLLLLLAAAIQVSGLRTASPAALLQQHARAPAGLANGGNATGGCTDAALEAACSPARRATVGHCLVCVQSRGPCSDVVADGFCAGGAPCPVPLPSAP